MYKSLFHFYRWWYITGNLPAHIFCTRDLPKDADRGVVSDKSVLWFSDAFEDISAKCMWFVGLLVKS